MLAYAIRSAVAVKLTSCSQVEKPSFNHPDPFFFELRPVRRECSQNGSQRLATLRLRVGEHVTARGNPRNPIVSRLAFSSDVDSVRFSDIERLMCISMVALQW
jgi:hypothetical protein